jgi:dolichyl-phosphate-mannose--protein O-mannosyl transferase
MPNFLTHPGSGAPVEALGMGHPFQAPNGYIFDEVYFAQDACKDLRGQDYLDPEPPLSKLVIAAGLAVAGTFMHYDRDASKAGLDPSAKPCETYGILPGFGTWGWRLSSLVFGTMLIPLIYLTAMRLWPDRFFAMSAALLMNFDGMSFVQSRIAMIDVIAIFFALLAYWVFLLHRDARSNRGFYRTAFLLALAVGLAVSAKWFGLATLGTVLVFLVGGYIARFVHLSTDGGWSWGDWWGKAVARVRVGPADQYARFLFYGLVLLVIPAALYLLSYFRYDTIQHCLEVAGSCDASRGLAPLAPVQLVHLGPLWLPRGIDIAGYIRQIWIHDQWAYQYHKNLTATHTYGSPWYTWIFLLRPVAYYYQDNVGCATVTAGVAAASSAAGCIPLRAEVFNLGNPAIWWASIPALVYTGWIAVKERSFAAALIVLAFLTAWLPFSRVSRVLFLYHMFGSLPFMVLAVAFAIARLRRRFALRVQLGPTRFPAVTGLHLAHAYLGLVVAMFVYFYPLWTGLPLSGDAWNQRVWINVNRDSPADFHISWI